MCSKGLMMFDVTGAILQHIVTGFLSLRIVRLFDLNACVESVKSQQVTSKTRFYKLLAAGVELWLKNLVSKVLLLLQITFCKYVKVFKLSESSI